MTVGQLDGRVALATNGARGQVRSHALALAAAGATVVVCGIAAQIPSVPYPMATPQDLDWSARPGDRRAPSSSTSVTAPP